jgi:hypothetical protein
MTDINHPPPHRTLGARCAEERQYCRKGDNRYPDENTLADFHGSIPSWICVAWAAPAASLAGSECMVVLLSF